MKKSLHRFGQMIGVRKEFNRSRLQYPLKKFYFRIIGLVLMSILSLLSLLPYAFYLYCKIKYDNLFYDNKKLRFIGKVKDIYLIFVEGLIIVGAGSWLYYNLTLPLMMDIANRFDKYISTLLITAINAIPTVVITTVFITRFYKWGQANAVFCYITFEKSYMKVNIIGSILNAIVKYVVTTISFGLGSPFYRWYRQRFLINRQYVSGAKIKFAGTIFSAYGWLSWRLLLSVITIGLYLPIYLYKMNEWSAKNTIVLK